MNADRIIRFINRHMHIETPGGTEKLKLRDYQEGIIQDFYNYEDVLILQSRQMGTSTTSQALVAAIMMTCPNSVIGVISRLKEDAAHFNNRVQKFIDSVPIHQKPKYKNKSMQFTILDNGSQLHAGCVSPANPVGVFRGKSINILIIEEASFIRHIDQAWISMIPSLCKVREQSKTQGNGCPQGIIISSVPSPYETGQWFLDRWYESQKGYSRFHHKTLHWSEYHTVHWYNQQKAALNYNQEKIAYELDCFVPEEKPVGVCKKAN